MNAAPPPPPPPPLPPVKRESRRRTTLVAVACVAGVFAALGIGIAAMFHFTRGFDPSDTQKACLVTAHDAARRFGFEVDGSRERWSGDRYFDGSLALHYNYEHRGDDPILIASGLTIERLLPDALVAYNLQRGTLAMGARLANSDLTLEPADHVFSWGDTSSFVFQVIDGERHGFAFITRQGNRVFSLDCWGLVLEETEELESFLTPHLERFASERF